MGGAAAPLPDKAKALAPASGEGPNRAISNNPQASTTTPGGPAMGAGSARGINRDLQGRAIQRCLPLCCGAANGFVLSPAQPSFDYFSASRLWVRPAGIPAHDRDVDAAESATICNDLQWLPRHTLLLPASSNQNSATPMFATCGASALFDNMHSNDGIVEDIRRIQRQQCVTRIRAINKHLPPQDDGAEEALSAPARRVQR
jgi:hypothetical protein